MFGKINKPQSPKTQPVSSRCGRYGLFGLRPGSRPGSSSDLGGSRPQDFTGLGAAAPQAPRMSEGSGGPAEPGGSIRPRSGPGARACRTRREYSPEVWPGSPGLQNPAGVSARGREPGPAEPGRSIRPGSGPGARACRTRLEYSPGVGPGSPGLQNPAGVFARGLAREPGPAEPSRSIRPGSGPGARACRTRPGSGGLGSSREPGRSIRPRSGRRFGRPLRQIVV
jgi:hypothetical protein